MEKYTMLPPSEREENANGQTGRREDNIWKVYGIIFGMADSGYSRRKMIGGMGGDTMSAECKVKVFDGGSKRKTVLPNERKFARSEAKKLFGKNKNSSFATDKGKVSAASGGTGMSKGRAIAAAGIIAFMAMMLSRPEYYLDSARRGLTLYATSVLPALFPFYFCSLLLTNMGAAKTASTLFAKPVRVLFDAPKESAYIMLLSMLSGYPVGASMTAELYGAGAITREDAKKIAAFASTSGPIFMLGTVGSAIFGDVRVGAVVLAAHYAAAILNGVIFGMIGRLKVGRAGKKNLQNADAGRDGARVRALSGEEYDNLMAKTIASSTLNMLYVGGYIVLCGMLADTLPLLRADVLLESAVGYEASKPILAALFGAIEMTRGCIAAAECSFMPLASALCAGMISLGGLSVTLQNYTFLSRCDMKLWEILIRKACQCAIAAAIGFALGFAV